ncbi:unnamed protein product [Scytosiphon promiscuus]
MMPGMAAGFGLPQGAGFGYHQQLARLQGSGTLNPFHYAPPHFLSPPPGLHGRSFQGSTLSPAAGASSGGQSAAVDQRAPKQGRVREGPAAQEVKEEPEDTLSPRPNEVEMVNVLRRHGVSTPDAVQSLRQSENRVDVALQYAMDLANTRHENRQLDRARLESEKEKDRAAEVQRLKDKTLMVLGEVIPHFPQSLLLNEEDGCAIFRRFVQKLSAGAGDGLCSPALCTFREKATTLLFLERDAFRHYPENSCQIRAYLRKLTERLENHHTEAATKGVGGMETTCASTVRGGTETAAKTQRPSGRARRASRGDENRVDEERETEILTARVQEEVSALQGILYHFPKTPGGVPDAFLDNQTAQNAATLERDGVEEDHDRNRSARTRDALVITIDD